MATAVLWCFPFCISCLSPYSVFPLLLPVSLCVSVQWVCGLHSPLQSSRNPFPVCSPASHQLITSSSMLITAPCCWIIVSTVRVAPLILSLQLLIVFYVTLDCLICLSVCPQSLQDSSERTLSSPSSVEPQWKLLLLNSLHLCLRLGSPCCITKHFTSCCKTKSTRARVWIKD